MPTSAPYYLVTEGDRHYVVNASGDFAHDTLQPGTYELRILEPKRTLYQNKLYWKWMGEISRVWGLDSDDVHEIVKKACISKKRWKMIHGKRISWQETQSTTSLSVKGFTILLDKVSEFAKRHNIPITQPNSYSDEDIQRMK